MHAVIVGTFCADSTDVNTPATLEGNRDKHCGSSTGGWVGLHETCDALLLN